MVMLQTRVGSEVAPERECERWIGNRIPGGGTRRKTARENGRLRVGPDRTSTRDSRFSPYYFEVRTGAAAAPPLLIFSGAND